MPEGLHLSPRHREAIEALLRAHLPDVEVWAYGSRVNGRSHDGSDLDLVLRGPKLVEIDASRLAEFTEALRESTVPFLVEARDWARLPDSFHREIERGHVVLNSEWRATTLGQIVTLQRGFDLPTAERKTGPYPVVASTGAVGTHDRAMVRGPGVVVGRSGSLGGGQFIKSDFWPLNTTLWVRDFNANDPRFCYFLLKSLDLKQFNAGSGVPTLNRNHIHPLPVHVPPVSEQRSIAHVLGTLDDKIELNRRMNATLEGMSRALFRSWFVDFDPVRAKMEGRDTGLPKEIADLFPDRLVDSELGEIPEGWPLVPLPELVEVNPPRKLRKGQSAPYLDMANMPTRGHAPDSVVRRPFGSGMRFSNGDTLVARITPCLENGKTAYVDFLRDDEIGWGSTEYIVMRSKQPLPSEFAYLLARSTRFREFAIQNMSGTSGRQRVPAAALAGFSIPSPPSQVSTEFGRAAQLLLRRARSAVIEIRFLSGCRDALLPKLVSGDLRVGELESLIHGQNDRPRS